MRAAPLIGLAVAFGACSVWMPGRSFEGAAPPLTPAQVASADRVRAHVTRLAETIGPRHLAAGDSLAAARAYIAAELAGAGWAVREQAYDFRGAAFHNIEARRAGTGEPFVVIGAHYDTVPGTPGANDNASGVAVLIELARALRDQPLAVPLRFVAFANEEPPYFTRGDGMGSVAYVAQFADPTASVAWMVSLETVGLYRDTPGSQRYPPGVGWLYPDRGNFVAFVANPASRRLLRQLVAAFRAVATLPSEGAALPAAVPGVAWSDHRSFWEAGIAAVMITDTAPFRDEAYHRAADTAERLDYAAMARLVDGLAHAIPTVVDERAR